MERHYDSFQSRILERKIEYLWFGSGGRALVMFPTSGGRFYEHEDRNLVSTLGDYVNEHRLQVCCIDSFNDETWNNSGLHPALTNFKQYWDAGEMAIVEGIGYPDPDLSHFNSMAKWMSGIPSGVPTTGWLGRWLDGYLAGSKDLFAATEIGYSVPLHLVGNVARGSVVPAGQPAFGVPETERDVLRFNTLRAMNSSPPSTWIGRVGQALQIAARLPIFELSFWSDFDLEPTPKRFMNRSTLSKRSTFGSVARSAVRWTTPGRHPLKSH